MTDTLERPEPLNPAENEKAGESKLTFGGGPFVQRGISSQPPEVQERWRKEMDAGHAALLQAHPLELTDDELNELVRSEVAAYREEHPLRRPGNPDAPSHD